MFFTEKVIATQELNTIIFEEVTKGGEFALINGKTSFNIHNSDDIQIFLSKLSCYPLDDRTPNKVATSIRDNWNI